SGAFVDLYALDTDGARGAGSSNVSTDPRRLAARDHGAEEVTLPLTWRRSRQVFDRSLHSLVARLNAAVAPHGSPLGSLESSPGNFVARNLFTSAQLMQGSCRSASLTLSAFSVSCQRLEIIELADCCRSRAAVI